MAYAILESADIAATKRSLEKASELMTVDDNILRQLVDGYLAVVLLMTGDAERGQPLYKKASAVVRFAIMNGDESHEVRELLATLELAAGNNDEAMKWLRDMYDVGFSDYRHLEHSGLFEPLRGDERFKQLLEKMRERNAEMRRRVLDYDRQHGYAR